MRACRCSATHRTRRVVLTGGPGAGKTAVLELIARTMCPHVVVLPEAAGIVFGGGFPRWRAHEALRAAQRAIYHVQHELEESVSHADAAIVVCDRGTIDGVAYWPGPSDLLSAVGSSVDAELARYDLVVHLRTPPAWEGYNHANPLRVETAAEASAIDDRIALAWACHPRRVEVPATGDFLAKARHALEIVARELPACCTP